MFKIEMKSNKTHLQYLQLFTLFCHLKKIVENTKVIFLRI